MTTMTSLQVSCIPEEIESNILSFLPISSLFRIKSVCKLWQTFSNTILNIHHSKFIARVKLYAVILAYLAETNNVGGNNGNWWYETGDILLPTELESINIDDTIYIKYTNYDLGYNQEEYQEKEHQDEEYKDREYQDEEYQDEEYQDVGHQDEEYQDVGHQDEEYQDVGNQDEEYKDIEHQDEDLIEKYLEGEIYEYPYENDDVSDMKLECYVCDQTPFLPVMVKYTASMKSRYQECFDAYAIVCRKCFYKRSTGRYYMQSYYYKNVDPVIGLKCRSLENPYILN